MIRSFVYSKNIRILMILALALGVFAFAAPREADATLILRLSNGSNTINISDGGVGDLSSFLGSVAWVGSIGGFDITISAATSKPLVGPGEIDLTVDITSLIRGGTFTVLATDTDFVSPLPTSLGGSIGGNTDGTVTMNTYIDDTNTAFGTQVSGAQIGPLTGNPFSGSGMTGLTGVDVPYSLTIETIIEHPAAGDKTSFDAKLNVPEPNALLLMGTCLVGLAGYARLRRRKSETR